jgi:hypothetical protein
MLLCCVLSFFVMLLCCVLQVSITDVLAASGWDVWVVHKGTPVSAVPTQQKIGTAP